MAHIYGAMLGIGVGYVAVIGIAAFISAKDVQSASLFLTLACCGVCGIIGLLCSSVVVRRAQRSETINTK